MEGKLRKTAYYLLILCLLFLSSACGKKSVATTQAVTEDPTLGFQTEKDFVRTTKDETGVYRTPDLSSPAYTVLDAGVELRRTGVKGTWTRIRLNDTTLYVQTSRVEKTEVKWAKEKEETVNHHAVYIDPAKQLYADSAEEDLFPEGKGEGKKAKMARGAVGVATGNFEYEITMDVAEKLKHELELRGYTVILSRAAATTSLSNMERAVNGNQSEGELLIRLSAHGSTNPETCGVLGLVASAENPAASGKYQESFYLANALLTEVCSATEVNRLGIYQTDQMTFLNHAAKPAASIQLGFLSNADEDRKLSDEEYQKELARGLANGVDTYFRYIDSINAGTENGGNSDE